MFICDPGFHAALLRQSSGRERKVFEISKKKKKKKKKNRKIQSGECLSWDLYDFFKYVCIKFVLEIISVCVWWYMRLAAGMSLSPGYGCSKV